ncbi:MAG: hypothetical protein ACM31L_08505 [Actinomycetota bacterium]
MDENLTTWNKLSAEDARDYHQNRSYEITNDIVKMALGISGAGLASGFGFFGTAMLKLVDNNHEDFLSVAGFSLSLLQGFGLVGAVALLAYIMNLINHILEWYRAHRYIGAFDSGKAKRAFKEDRGFFVTMNIIIGGTGFSAGVYAIVLLVRIIADIANQKVPI